MERDWARLASRLAAARRATGKSQGAVAAELGIGRSSIQTLENQAHAYRKILPMHRLAATYYGWADGSVERVLAGGEPILQDGTVSARPDGSDETFAAAPGEQPGQEAFEILTAGMSDRAVEAMQRGRTIDTRVVDVSAGAAAVLIFKAGASDASPEEKARYMRQWDALQKAALEIFSDQE